MKVLINGNTLIVGWNYESKIIAKACKKLGVNRDALKGKSKREICAFLDLKSFPIPEKTTCIIRNEETGDIFTGEVRRYHLDPWNRDEARRKSLTKALWQLFPEGGIEGHSMEHSENRAKFWDMYNSRTEELVGEKLLKRLVKAGYVTLEDIKEYANSNHVVTFAK